MTSAFDLPFIGEHHISTIYTLLISMCYEIMFEDMLIFKERFYLLYLALPCKQAQDS